MRQASRRTVDPLGGSYYLENLTNPHGDHYCQQDERSRRGKRWLGQCVRTGWLERQINEARYKNQRDLDERTPVDWCQPLSQHSPRRRSPIKIHKIKASEWGERRAEYLR